MQAKQLQADGQTTWVLVFDTDDEFMTELQRFAREQRLGGSHFSGIGAFRRAVLGYFDWDSKDYKRNPIEEQVEVVTLTGFVTEGDDGPKIHAHVALGRADGLAYGGHLLEGVVRPTLELEITESPRHLRRREDPETGLPLIDPDAPTRR
jgi:predicted DNA-binding protein with PD1-like motif